MKPKILTFCLASIFSIMAVAQTRILEDGIYYVKGDEKKIEAAEIQQIDSEQTEILIAEPEVRNYEEGVIIYKNEEGLTDTLYIYGDSKEYMDLLTPQTKSGQK